MIANVQQVAKEGDLRLHPMVPAMLDPEVLEKMGARRNARDEAGALETRERQGEA